MRQSVVLLASLLLAAPALFPAENAEWAKPAAAYLDSRMDWWSGWKGAARDHDTFCVSCHTSLPYAVARPVLQSKLGEKSAAAPQQKLVGNTAQRVRIWNSSEPFYPTKKPDDPKTIESRGTEAILNALVLTSTGFNADTQSALDNMWSEQIQTGENAGSWNWLQFHNAPWEGDSQFYGTVLAAIATGNAPKSYLAKAELQPKIKLMKEYLAKHQATEKLMDRVTLLWASSKLDGLLTKQEKAAIAREAVARQQADGGFSLTGFIAGWKRRDDTALETRSDGYATGLVTLALLSTGEMQKTNPVIQRAMGWMRENQDRAEGRWLAYSMNKQRDLSTDIGKFMSDAATAYCALALSY